MQEFIVLFVIAGAWLLFAMVQDVKTREVANWLTFSLIAIALAFRASLAVVTGAWEVLVWGIIGGAVFVVLAYALYYGRVFAGGDAKLLMGVGIALPYATGSELLGWGSLFFALLLTAGAGYTLLYSFVLVARNWRKFRKAFRETLLLRETKRLFVFVASLIFIAMASLVLAAGTETRTFEVLFYAKMTLLVTFLVSSLPLVYVYLTAVEKSCLQKVCEASELQEGDWLARGVRMKGKVIEASLHGLSREEIESLKRAKKRVIIKEGIVFVPAFVLAYGIMVYVAAVSGTPWAWAWSVLSSLAEAFLNGA